MADINHPPPPTTDPEDPIALPQLVIDGLDFDNLTEFYSTVSEILLQGCHDWGGNLDAFNDVLRGGFGTPENGYVIVWKNSAISKKKLGSKFDTLIEIIQIHCPGGGEEEDNVRLRLE